MIYIMAEQHSGPVSRILPLRFLKVDAGIWELATDGMSDAQGGEFITQVLFGNEELRVIEMAVFAIGDGGELSGGEEMQFLRDGTLEIDIGFVVLVVFFGAVLLHQSLFFWRLLIILILRFLKHLHRHICGRISSLFVLILHDLFHRDHSSILLDFECLQLFLPLLEYVGTYNCQQNLRCRRLGSFLILAKALRHNMIIKFNLGHKLHLGV